MSNKNNEYVVEQESPGEFRVRIEVITKPNGLADADASRAVVDATDEVLTQMLAAGIDRFIGALVSAIEKDAVDDNVLFPSMIDPRADYCRLPACGCDGDAHP